MERVFKRAIIESCLYCCYCTRLWQLRQTEGFVIANELFYFMKYSLKSMYSIKAVNYEWLIYWSQCLHLFFHRADVSKNMRTWCCSGVALLLWDRDVPGSILCMPAHTCISTVVWLSTAVTCTSQLWTTTVIFHLPWPRVVHGEFVLP